MRKYVSLVVGMLVLVGAGCQSANTLPQPEPLVVENTNSQAIALDQNEETALRAAVSAAVNEKTKGMWDKELTIASVHESKQAVKGKWMAKDAWDWMAWKQDSAWNVLASLDGFDCAEIKNVPSQYADFFHDVLNDSVVNNCSSQPSASSTAPISAPVSQPVPPSPAAEQKTVGAVKEFTVSGANFTFAPTTIAVRKGDTVKITFKNVEGFHDLKIDEFNAATGKIGAGKEDIVTFVADKAGSFEYYCSVGSHRAMGMKGTLIVE